MIFRGSALREPSSTGQKADIIQDVLRYLDTDTIWYHIQMILTLVHFSSYFETDDRIYLKQVEVWTPIIESLNRHFHFSLQTTQNISRIHQDEDIRFKIREVLASSSPHSLAGILFLLLPFTYASFLAFEYLTRNLKSALLPLALKFDLISGPDAVHASLLEQEAQSAQWGIIPESHALQRSQLERHVALALTLL